MKDIDKQARDQQRSQKIKLNQSYKGQEVEERYDRTRPKKTCHIDYGAWLCHKNEGDLEIEIL